MNMLTSVGQMLSLHEIPYVVGLCPKTQHTEKFHLWSAG